MNAATIETNKKILVIGPIDLDGELLLKAIHSLTYYAVITSTEHVYHSMLQNSKVMIDRT